MLSLKRKITVTNLVQFSYDTFRKILLLTPLQLWLTQLDVEQGILLVRILLDDLQRDLFSGKRKRKKGKK